MNTDELFKVLSAIHPISDDFKKSLEKELTQMTFPKYHLLVEAPKVAEHVFFMERGFAMSFGFQDGKKFIDAFWKAGQILTSAGSFFEQVPSFESIQLLETSDLLCLSHSSLLGLFSDHEETHYLYHKIMNQHFASCRARIQDIQRLGAAVRFERLLKVYPDIEQFASQDNIASYLGITPQSLSRIKRQRND